MMVKNPTATYKICEDVSEMTDKVIDYSFFSVQNILSITFIYLYVISLEHHQWTHTANKKKRFKEVLSLVFFVEYFSFVIFLLEKLSKAFFFKSKEKNVILRRTFLYDRRYKI